MRSCDLWEASDQEHSWKRYFDIENTSSMALSGSRDEIWVEMIDIIWISISIEHDPVDDGRMKMILLMKLVTDVFGHINDKSTPSRPLGEVKLVRARLVVRWVTTCEARVLKANHFYRVLHTSCFRSRSTLKTNHIDRDLLQHQARWNISAWNADFSKMERPQSLYRVWKSDTMSSVISTIKAPPLVRSGKLSSFEPG